MNARKFLNVRVSLTVTALALSAAVGLSSLTTSCASSPSSGGSTGSGGTSSNGGTGGSGGGSGGSAGSGGGGGAGGDTSTTSTGNCPDPITNGVNFCDGQAQGDLMKGYAFVALGIQDFITSPRCAEDPSDLTNLRDITAPDIGQCTQDGKTCPTNGRTVWPDSDKLCIKGSIPIVTKGDAGTLDYTADWGLQIGVNTDSTPAADGGKTLGQQFSDASKFTSITITTSGAPSPTSAVIRAEIHILNQTCTEYAYCATMTSGKPMLLSAFNTECWGGSNCKSATDGLCKELKPEDIASIDKIGVQISGDERKAYTVDGYCLEKIEFGTD